jgi:hypothetical protein
MALNPYFKFQGTEQNVVEDNIVEIIRMMGKNVWYIPRESVNLDRLFGEDQLNRFTKAYQVEMYVASVAGFEGSDLVTKFGLEIKDRVNLIVSKKRFSKEITTKNSTIIRPREGDLIFFPLTKTLFEINFVEHELPFYQLDKNYVYTLSCETFVYSAEHFDTGNTDMDTLSDTKQSVFNFSIGATFSGFTAAYNKAVRGEKYFVTGSIAGTTAYFRLLDFDLEGSGMTALMASIDGVTFNNPITVTSDVSGSTFRVLSVSTTNKSVTINPVLDDLEGEISPLDYQRGFTGSGSKIDTPIINFSEVDPFSEGNY